MKEDRFINHFDPSESDVKDFLRNLAVYSEDFDFLVFDHYARYEFSNTWYRLRNINGILTITQLKLSEVKV